MCSLKQVTLKKSAAVHKKIVVVENTFFLMVLLTDLSSIFSRRNLHNCILKFAKGKQTASTNHRNIIHRWQFPFKLGKSLLAYLSVLEVNTQIVRVRSSKTLPWIIWYVFGRNKLYVWHACCPNCGLPDYRQPVTAKIKETLNER